MFVVAPDALHERAQRLAFDAELDDLAGMDPEEIRCGLAQPHRARSKRCAPHALSSDPKRIVELIAIERASAQDERRSIRVETRPRESARLDSRDARNRPERMRRSFVEMRALSDAADSDVQIGGKDSLRPRIERASEGRDHDGHRHHQAEAHHDRRDAERRITRGTGQLRKRDFIGRHRTLRQRAERAFDEPRGRSNGRDQQQRDRCIAGQRQSCDRRDEQNARRERERKRDHPRTALQLAARDVARLERRGSWNTGRLDRRACRACERNEYAERTEREHFGNANLSLHRLAREVARADVAAQGSKAREQHAEHDAKRGAAKPEQAAAGEHESELLLPRDAERMENREFAPPPEHGQGLRGIDEESAREQRDKRERREIRAVRTR